MILNFHRIGRHSPIDPQNSHMIVPPTRISHPVKEFSVIIPFLQP
jgi:hypothetical protein